MVINSVITKLKAPTEERGYFVSTKLSQQPDLVFGKAGKLESTFAEFVLLNKRNIVYGFVCTHFSLKTKFLNDEYLTPLLARINKEGKGKYVY